jgi:hypothetical protein
MQAYGCSRSSLLQRLGIGDVWSFLRDLIQNTMLRADFYDGEGNFYHGLANSIGGEGTVSLWSAGTEGIGETVNDYWQGNPQSEEFVMAPGVTAFVRSSNRYQIASPGSAWSADGTHKELVHKISINGETWYGRIPIWTENHNEAHYAPNPGNLISTTVISFGQTSTALAAVQGAIVDLNNKLQLQGILRVVDPGEGPG